MPPRTGLVTSHPTTSHHHTTRPTDQAAHIYSNPSPPARTTSTAQASPTVHHELRTFLTTRGHHATAALPPFLDQLALTTTPRHNP